MKRFHVHLHVDDPNRSIGFYSQLFAAQPARVEGDYAKTHRSTSPSPRAAASRASTIWASRPTTPTNSPP